MGISFDNWRRRSLKLVEAALEAALPKEAGSSLGAAMRYAVLGGGKRLRPLLALAAAEAAGGPERAALPLAVAVELVHAYSLAHDDLPAMDDDEQRRGRPSCWKVFGEGPAILAGDALLTLAFAVLLKPGAAGSDDRRRLAAADLARAAGAAGLVGGQALDLAMEGRPGEPEEIRRMERLKTGALMSAALVGGARLAGAPPAPLRRLGRLGLDLGLAFQIKDDLLNQAGDPALTGKAVGSDAARGKATLPSLLGPAAAEKELRSLGRRLKRQAETFQPRGGPLRGLLNALSERRS